MPEHTIPESLVQQIGTGRAVLVVGAGVGTASWKHLLEQMNEKLKTRGEDGDDAAAKDVAKLLHKGSLVRAAGFLARSLGEQDCDDIVAEAWQTPDEFPEHVKALASLPFRHVWTTFPGDVLEKSFAEDSPEDWPETQVVTYEDASEIKDRRRTLLKILGDFDSYIVTPKSVRRALSKATDLQEHARGYYSSGALVFVGFRFGDPDLSALLDRVFGMFEPPEGNHYLIASGVGPVTVDELANEHHVEVINLAGKGADETATDALLEWLTELQSACDAAEITLSQEQPDEDDLDGWLAILGKEPENEEARTALELIEVSAKEAGDADRMTDVLMGQVEVETSGPKRAVLLRRLAGVFENEVGDLPRAFTALTVALREDPGDTTAVDEAERLAQDTDGWAELVGDVSEIAGEIEDPQIAAGYWARLGRWYLDKLHHSDYALASYRQAIRLDASNLPAHTGLEELYRKQQRWAELADVLESHIELVRTDSELADTESLVDLYLSAGDLYETQLASTSRATEAYQAAADLDESQDDALAALERLYRRDERWGKLARVLEQRAEQFDAQGDSQRVSAIRRELATLRADKLGDLEGAIGKYESALESDESDVAALRALEELYDKVGRTDDYLRTLERLAAVAPEAERLAVMRRLAAELEDRDGMRAKAIEYYERVVEADPSNEGTYPALERLFRADGQWYELVSTLERHIGVVKAPAPKVELCLDMAQVYEKQLDDPHRAIEAYLNTLNTNEEHRGALEALARLYVRTEAFDRAVDILVRHAELEGDKGASMWAEAGALADSKLEDYDVAERHLEKALELDAAHLKAMLGLAQLHRHRGSWANAVTFLTAAEQHSSNRLERVQLLSDAAEIADEKLEDPDRALGLVLRILTLDAEHVEAGTWAADRLVTSARWEEALPILEMLARKADPEDRNEKAERESSLGAACEALGLHEKAAKHYGYAVEADPENLGAALGFASMLFAEISAAEQGSDETKERWKEVDKRYRELLARHRGGLADGQVVEIWLRIGTAARALEDLKQADNAYRRALERDPSHPETLSAMIEVAELREDWKTVVEAKRDQVDASDEAGKLKLFSDMGDIYGGKLNDPDTALGAYLEAIKMRPDSHVLLHKTLEIYTVQKQWRRAVDTLATLASHEAEIKRRAKYHYAGAVIARDELKDTELAAEYFDKALDDEPTTPKAFDAIDKLLSDRGDWKNLARAHRRMLKRVGDTAPTALLLRLWTRLGDICLDNLNDPESALAAFEVAVSLDPANMDRHEQLANLYLEAGDERRQDAIDELQILIQANPDRVELYRALSNLYQEEGDTDKSYCLAQALVFLGAATDKERSLYDQHRSESFSPVNRRLTEELWQKSIIHQKENRHVNAIFSSLVGSIASTTAQPANAFNLSDRERSDVTTDKHLVARMFKYASDVLALDPQPQLYLQPSSSEGIRVANTSASGKLAPSVLVGDPQLNQRDERMLAFEVGKRLAYFRPERYVTYALQTLPKLEGAYAAALVASGAGDDGAVSGDSARMAKHLRKTVPGAVLDQVGTVAKKSSLTMGNGVITTWRSATDLTANRIGFILCDDFETAAKLIATEQSGMSTMAAKDRLRDLLAYSVSENYFAVRRHLGVGIRD